MEVDTQRKLTTCAHRQLLEETLLQPLKILSLEDLLLQEWMGRPLSCMGCQTSNHKMLSNNSEVLKSSLHRGVLLDIASFSYLQKTGSTC